MGGMTAGVPVSIIQGAGGIREGEGGGGVLPCGTVPTPATPDVPPVLPCPLTPAPLAADEFRNGAVSGVVTMSSNPNASRLLTGFPPSKAYPFPIFPGSPQTPIGSLLTNLPSTGSR